MHAGRAVANPLVYFIPEFYATLEDVITLSDFQLQTEFIYTYKVGREEFRIDMSVQKLNRFYDKYFNTLHFHHQKLALHQNGNLE
jgi:hypothetical protein